MNDYVELNQWTKDVKVATEEINIVATNRKL